MNQSLYYSILLVILISSCLKPPSATMTDEYIKLVKPGDDWALVEVEVIKYDSILDRPVEMEFINSYWVINKITKKPINGSKTHKIYFSKPDSKYQWVRLKERLSNDYEYLDSFRLKKRTWYTLTTTRYDYQVLFYWNGDNGDYVIRLNSISGAW